MKYISLLQNKNPSQPIIASIPKPIAIETPVNSSSNLSLSSSSSTLAEVMAWKGPLICEIVVDPDQVWAPKLQSKLLEDGTFQTPPLDDMFPFLDKLEIEELRQRARKI